VTIDRVRRAIEKVREDDSGLCWFAGERSEELVEAAEKALGFSFPPPYRLFVRELGAGSVGADEIFGVTSADFEKSTVPNGVWLTLAARRNWHLPGWMMVVYFDGGVDYYVMDVRVPDPPLVVWRPGVTRSPEDLTIMHESFGDFLADIVGCLNSHQS
jgi:antitoxin YobK